MQCYVDLDDTRVYRSVCSDFTIMHIDHSLSFFVVDQVGLSLCYSM